MTKKQNAEGFTYAYTDNEKEKQAIVFIHGLPTCKELFVPLAEQFAGDYRTVAIDLIDYGESEKAGRHLEHKERAAGLKSLLESLQLDKIILVCHDLGVSVCMDLMALCPERIERLVIMSPPVYPDFKEPGVVKLVRSRPLGPMLIAAAGKLLLRQSVKKGLYNKEAYDRWLKAPMERAFSGKEGRKALFRNLNWGRPARVFAEYPHIIKSITQPALVLQGLKDPFIPVSHAERLAADLPEGQLELLENAGHFLPIDVPEALAERIKRFLASDSEI